MSSISDPRLSLRPLEDRDMEHIARNQPCPDISHMFDFKPDWAPINAAQLRDKVAEQLKKPLTAVFAIYSGEALVGMGKWSASWDTWSPHAWFVVLPDHRRKGLGTAIASLLLDKCFLENPGHEVAVAVSDSNAQAIGFLKKLGFRDIGRMRRVTVEGGKYHDLLFFDILKSEYLAGVKP